MLVRNPECLPLVWRVKKFIEDKVSKKKVKESKRQIESVLLIRRSF